MTSEIPQRTEVFIVGAGPTGLAAALALHKQGCRDMVIVDSILAGENTSRALVVHAATLEALDEIGCAKPLIAAGVQATGVKLWDGERFHTGLADFSILATHTKFPFILIVPQHITERVLGQRVKEEGIVIHRPVKVVEVNANHADPSLTDVRFEDGRTVQTRYLIGADGAHSTVRQCAGIHYADPDGETVNNENIAQAVIADVVFSSPPPVGRTEVFFATSNGNFFLCVPVPSSAYDGAEVWRIATGVRTGVPPHAPPKEYLQGLVDAYGPGSIPASALPDRTPLNIERAIWSTRFRTHSALSDRCFTRLFGGTGGVVVLVGDAAHLHPPAGGQGMNLGLRDAVSLGPVLAEHIGQGRHSSAADARLKQWADNRHSQALKVIGLAKTMLVWAGTKNTISFYCGFIPVNWFRIRNLVLWLGEVTGIAKTKLPWALSGLLNR